MKLLHLVDGWFVFLGFFFSRICDTYFIFFYSNVKFKCGIWVGPTNLLRKNPNNKPNQYILEQTGKNDAVQRTTKGSCRADSISALKKAECCWWYTKYPGFFFACHKFARIGNCVIFLATVIYWNFKNFFIEIKTKYNLSVLNNL